MKKYKVVFANTAENDLSDIVIYLSNFSHETALKYYDDIMRKVNSLTSMPERCAFVNDSVLRAVGFRWLVVHNYVIFFIVNNNSYKVQVRRILYSGRDYTALL
jgi:plasmid stabilization system protein ParE